ncbi:MAG: hypothetical protein RIE73_23695 [Coleofasciculus sp. C1-SOL-03]|uniref:DUF6973 domain-containing protein n=1 Tax=Coleofasciculus sp. C1-SOL-03 TaxID=3069522 RepID=UPI0032F5DFAF
MYKPLQKKNSSWTPTTVQKKSKSPSKLGHFSIQPKPNQKSSQSQEIGEYSRDSADRLTANVMRSLEAKGSQETETPTVQPQSESRISVADVVGQRMPTVTPHTLSPLQRKLTVGQPGDKYEQEADTVAAKVVEQINSPTSQQSVQGKVESGVQPVEYKNITLQAKAEPIIQRDDESEKPPLEQIIRDYQVQDDQVTNWSPTAFGAIPIPFTGEYRVTETEAELLDNLSFNRGLMGLNTFNTIKNRAFDESENQFPQPSNIPAYVPDERQAEWVGNDGHRDAFRHAYWNSLLVRNFGKEWTNQFTTAHEALPGNPATREAMDLYNNEVGRQIAIDNPEANDVEIADLVRQASDNGELIVIDQSSKLAWSNQVPLWQHGLTDGTPGRGGQPVPEGNASAQ